MSDVGGANSRRYGICRSLTPANQCETAGNIPCLKNRSRRSLSGLLLFSGAVTAANADEATPIDTTGYAAAAEVLADNGVASSAATAMQTGSGLRLAQEASGLLDGGESCPSINWPPRPCCGKRLLWKSRTFWQSMTAFW